MATAHVRAASQRLGVRVDICAIADGLALISTTIFEHLVAPIGTHQLGQHPGHANDPVDSNRALLNGRSVLKARCILEFHQFSRNCAKTTSMRSNSSGLTAQHPAVPGMPLGSPGMEAPRSEPYEALLIDRRGRTSIYARYAG